MKLSDIHSGRLLDRHAVPVPKLVIQDNGRIVDALVKPQDVPAAASLWGGATALYYFSGRQAWFLPEVPEDCWD